MNSDMTPLHDTKLSMDRAPHKATRAVVRRLGEPDAKRLYTAFTAYNRSYFQRRLAPAMVLITEVSRALGDYRPKDVHGLQSVIRIAPKTVQRGERMALDTLLHEMVHAYCHEVLHTDEPGYRGHGPAFAEVCNRIGEKLGLAPVGVAKRDGLPPCNYWPMNVRPEGYYPEPFTEPKRESKNKDDGDESAESDEDTEEMGAVLPVPSVRALVGAGLVAELLDDKMIEMTYTAGNQRANVRALRTYLVRLASYLEANGGKPPKNMHQLRIEADK